MLPRLLPLLLLPVLAAPGTAQIRADSRIAPPVAPPAERPASHRIFTLAWTEEYLAAGVATEASATSPRPHPARQFVLTWQEVAKSVAQPVQVAGSTAACVRTILVALPCAD